MRDTETPTEFQPDNPLLAKTVQKSETPAPKTRRKQLPLMRQLLNILGEPVRDLIPFDLRQAVDTIFEFNKINPDVFQTTPFDSVKERDECITLMRAYGEMAGDYGYTIYTQDDEDETLLVWKVTLRRGAKEQRAKDLGFE
jgi:hypothetical protein